MRLGIDGEALRLPLSGVGQYVHHLCHELEQLWPQGIGSSCSPSPQPSPYGRGSARPSCSKVSRIPDLRAN